MIRVYFNRFIKFNSEKWHWKPYTGRGSPEEQREWNELFLKTRARRDGEDKIIKDFSSIEKDADQFGLIEVVFTDIFGLKWLGRKGTEEEVGEPDYEGSLYYFDPEDAYDYDDISISDEYNNYDNPPDPKVYYKFNVGYPRWRTEYIDIANVKDLSYTYIVENHLFKDTRVTLRYEDGEEVDIFSSHQYDELAYALKHFGKEDLLKKFCEKVDEHFEKLKNSENEDERDYYPGYTAIEYFKSTLRDRNEVSKANALSLVE